MKQKHVNYWVRLPILSVDLIFVAFTYLFLIIFVFSNNPTAAELGYGINSPEVASQQRNVVLLGVVVWVVYGVVMGLIFGRSLGGLFLGFKLISHEESRIKKMFSILFSPLIMFDKVLGVKIVRSRNSNILNKALLILATLSTFVTIPGLIAFIFLVGILLFVPRSNISNNFTLCGERFCIVKANNACEKNIDYIRSRVVEIVGENFTGTGFLVSDSLVLTNYHVVEQEPVVSIREANGRVSQAKVYNANPDLDMAILVGQFTPGEHIQFANPRDFGEGTTDLYAIGYPGSVLRQAGTGNVTVTSGIYSSFLDYPEYGLQLVQTDAAVNPGNSGGPLVNKCGQVFGMVTLTERLDPVTRSIKEGLNYAISSTTLVPELNRLSK